MKTIVVFTAAAIIAFTPASSYAQVRQLQPSNQPKNSVLQLLSNRLQSPDTMGCFSAAAAFRHRLTAGATVLRYHLGAGRKSAAWEPAA